MKKVILITGASTGIGNATALYFAHNGWDVVATMRNPEKRRTGLEGIEGITLMHLDVLDLKSIQTAVSSVAAKFGRIDAVLNNAGYAVQGPFEAATREQVKQQYDTNVIGLMDVCREVIPVFRKQGFGSILNVASIGGKVGMPFYSLYNSTKFAVEGFTEVLGYELRPFGIKVRLIEPGIIITDFYNRSMVTASKPGLTEYDNSFAAAQNTAKSFMALGSKPEAAAKVIYKAANDTGNKLRYSIGVDAIMVLALRKLLPDFLFLPYIKNMMKQ